LVDQLFHQGWADSFHTGPTSPDLDVALDVNETMGQIHPTETCRNSLSFISSAFLQNDISASIA
jgi:hypothetical protein